MFKAHELVNFPAGLAVLFTQIEAEYKKHASNQLQLTALVNERRASKVATLTVSVKGEKRSDDPALELAIHKVISQPAYKGQYARQGKYIGFAKDVAEVLENEVILAKLKAEKEAKKQAEKEAEKVEKTDSQDNEKQQNDVPKETQKAKKAKKVKD